MKRNCSILHINLKSVDFASRLSGLYYVLIMMMASAQVVEMLVNTNNSPSQDYTTNPDDHSNHNIIFLKQFTSLLFDGSAFSSWSMR